MKVTIFTYCDVWMISNTTVVESYGLVELSLGDINCLFMRVTIFRYCEVVVFETSAIIP